MMRGYGIILKLAALLVPGVRRTEWRAEWTAELWYVLQSPDAPALCFCLGAFKDALWLRRNPSGEIPLAGKWLRSPWQCLAWLGCLACVATAFFVYSIGASDPFPRTLHDFRAPVLVYVLFVGLAFVLVSINTSLSMGEYPAARSSPARARRFYRRGFFLLKFALIIPIVLFGTFDVVKLLSAPAYKVMRPMGVWALQPQAALIFFVIAFRWALRDQRRRCPVCLRLLDESASIGQFSHNFLEWYGTELFCGKGHGLLHVPDIKTSYSTQEWRDLDRSWSVLFS